MVQETAARLAGKAAVVQVNVDESPRLAGRFAVRSVPVLHVVRGGESVASLSGTRSAESIVAWFESHI